MSTRRWARGVVVACPQCGSAVGVTSAWGHAAGRHRELGLRERSLLAGAILEAGRHATRAPADQMEGQKLADEPSQAA